jgi:hypothetical protein
MPPITVTGKAMVSELSVIGAYPADVLTVIC